MWTHGQTAAPDRALYAVEERARGSALRRPRGPTATSPWAAATARFSGRDQRKDGGRVIELHCHVQAESGRALRLVPRRAVTNCPASRKPDRRASPACTEAARLPRQTGPVPGFLQDLPKRPLVAWQPQFASRSQPFGSSYLPTCRFRWRTQFTDALLIRRVRVRSGEPDFLSAEVIRKDEQESGAGARR